MELTGQYMYWLFNKTVYLPTDVCCLPIICIFCHALMVKEATALIMYSNIIV